MRSVLRSTVLAVLLIGAASAPEAAAQAAPSPIAVETPLQAELRELAAAPISHKVLFRLEQINDSLKAVEDVKMARLFRLMQESRNLQPSAAVSDSLFDRHHVEQLNRSRLRHSAKVLPIVALSSVGYLYGAARPDAGGYADSYRSIDKEAHAASCAVLYAGMRSLGAPRWLAFVAPLAAGYALERGQASHGGYSSRKDLVANGAGCSAALAFDLIRR